MLSEPAGMHGQQVPSDPPRLLQQMVSAAGEPEGSKEPTLPNSGTD